MPSGGNMPGETALTACAHSVSASLVTTRYTPPRYVVTKTIKAIHDKRRLGNQSATIDFSCLTAGCSSILRQLLALLHPTCLSVGAVQSYISRAQHRVRTGDVDPQADAGTGWMKVRECWPNKIVTSHNWICLMALTNRKSGFSPIAFAQSLARTEGACSIPRRSRESKLEESEHDLCSISVPKKVAAGLWPRDGIRGGGRGRPHRAAARQSHLVVPLAQRVAAPAATRPLHRP